MGHAGPALTAAEGTAALLVGAPRQPPVPEKEPDVPVREIFTFGGPGKPDMSGRRRQRGRERKQRH